MNYDAWKLASGIPETVDCPHCIEQTEAESYGSIYHARCSCPTCNGAGEIDEQDARRLCADARAERDD